MKRIAATILAAVMLLGLLQVPACAEGKPSEIVSEAYCVMYAETGQLLVAGNPDMRMEPASITKIMTCALALEYLNPEDTYTFSREAASYDQGSTHLAMTQGETVTIRDLLYGAMVESANDCAMGLADAVSGSQSDFTALMNEKARELGCTGTHFTNSTGMPDPDHYTTARDMGLITRYAMGVEGFNTYFSAWEWTIPATNKNSERTFGTHHAMIVGPENNSVFGYEGAFGGKLGWTEEAKHTMVTAAERDGVTLICVVLKSTQKYSKYKDSIKLLDYCFGSFEAAEIPVSVPKCEVTLTEDGSVYGKMTVYPMASVNVLLTSDMSKSDVSVSSGIPDSCELGNISDVSLRVEFSRTSPNMETETVKVIPTNYISRDSRVLDGDGAELVDRGERTQYRWWLFLVIPLGIIAVLAIAVLIIRAYNIRKYSKLRKHRHYERLKHQ